MGFLDDIRGRLSEQAKKAAKDWLDSKVGGGEDLSDKSTEHRSPRRGPDVVLPDLAVDAVEQWERSGRPRQKPIEWPQEEWIAEFPELDRMLRAMSNPLARGDVRKLVGQLPRDEDGAVTAFVACMAWGYGRTGYGRSRTRNVLESSRNAAAKLAGAREIAMRGDLRAAFDAYVYLSDDGRLDHLGPAFGTKFIHFHNAEGLILDKLTAEWYQRACGIDLKPTQWNPSKYREYLAFMGGWAEALGIAPDQLEEIAFSQISRERGNQWA